jgi:uncharacterized membrane protein (DUF106 family)
MKMAFEFIGNATNSVLSPLLTLHPFLAIALVALVLSILITVIYKYTTNQKELKQLKEETTQLQKDMKAAKNDLPRMTELNQKLLEITGKQMKHTLRSYIFTFLPVILIFGWLQGHMAYTQILPGQEFTTTAVFDAGTAPGNITLSAPGLDLLSPAMQQANGQQASWKLKGELGEYTLEYTYGKEIYLRDVIISEKWEYANAAPNKGIPKESNIKSITVDLKPIHPFGFSIFGWQPGWFATYFILTMLLTFPLRKALKVY